MTPNDFLKFNFSLSIFSFQDKKLTIYLIDFKSTSFFTHMHAHMRHHIHTCAHKMTQKDFLAARNASINIGDRKLLFGN